MKSEKIVARVRSHELWRAIVHINSTTLDGRLVVTGGAEIVTADDHIIAFDGDGHTLWRRSGIGGPIASADGMLYASTRDGLVQTILPGTGRITRTLRACSDEAIGWLIPFRDRLVVGCLNAATGDAEIKRLSLYGSIERLSRFTGGNVATPDFIRVDDSHVLLRGVVDGATLFIRYALVDLTGPTIKAINSSFFVAFRHGSLFFSESAVTPDNWHQTVRIDQFNLDGNLIKQIVMKLPLFTNESDLSPGAAYVTEGATFASAGSTLYRMDAQSKKPAIITRGLAWDAVAGRHTLLFQSHLGARVRVFAIDAEGKKMQELPFALEPAVMALQAGEDTYGIWSTTNGTAALNLDGSSIVYVAQRCAPTALNNQTSRFFILCRDAGNTFDLLAFK